MWLQNKRVDVAMLQETKLRAEDTKIEVRGCSVIHRDRCRENMSGYARGGGFMTLVRKDWKHRVVNHGIGRWVKLESLWVEVVHNMMRVWN